MDRNVPGTLTWIHVSEIMISSGLKVLHRTKSSSSLFFRDLALKYKKETAFLRFEHNVSTKIWFRLFSRGWHSASFQFKFVATLKKLRFKRKYLISMYGNANKVKFQAKPTHHPWSQQTYFSVLSRPKPCVLQTFYNKGFLACMLLFLSNKAPLQGEVGGRSPIPPPLFPSPPLQSFVEMRAFRCRLCHCSLRPSNKVWQQRAMGRHGAWREANSWRNFAREAATKRARPSIGQPLPQPDAEFQMLLPALPCAEPKMGDSEKGKQREKGRRKD